jgi:inhibitor of KinA sporulation pathway (predicted exonuclease)
LSEVLPHLVWAAVVLIIAAFLRPRQRPQRDDVERDLRAIIAGQAHINGQLEKMRRDLEADSERLTAFLGQDWYAHKQQFEAEIAKSDGMVRELCGKFATITSLRDDITDIKTQQATHSVALGLKKRTEK